MRADSPIEADSQVQPDGLPKVAVLLATHDGERYLEEQLDTILSQEGVRLRLIVSDDASTDGTMALLEARAADDPRIELLPPGRYGSPSANFYRLLTEAPLEDDEHVAFADQDDRWLPGKLARHARLLAERGADGVSSNVWAFDETGARRLIRKDHPQRLLDYCFETPGPGCSMLLTPRLARLVIGQLENPDSPARDAWSHDLLVYALCRAAGLRWIVDSTPSLEYRQHGANAIGANGTIGAAAKRLQLAATRWHRKLVGIVVESCIHVAAPSELPRLQWAHELLSNPTPTNLARLARRADAFRRRPRDRVVLAALMTSGLW
ncbi:Putative glycosyltransferase EpsE [Pseudoclavibacter triregionum]|nr:Putative glycosyltransferase EpsE [Pseudoclavibacter triregionum]